MSKSNLIKQNELLKKLKAGNEQEFSKNLAELDAVLTIEALPSLVSVFHAPISEKCKDYLLIYFNDLSALDAQETMIQILMDPENLIIRKLSLMVSLQQIVFKLLIILTSDYWTKYRISFNTMHLTFPNNSHEKH